MLRCAFVLLVLAAAGSNIYWHVLPIISRLPDFLVAMIFIMAASGMIVGAWSVYDQVMKIQKD